MTAVAPFSRLRESNSLSGTSVVNSWNEWDRLQEIVIGSADGACYDPVEPGYRPQVRLRAQEEPTPFPTGPKPTHVIAKANEELEGLAEICRSRGVVVQRPEPRDYSQSIRTPHFEVQSQYCGVCPRDVMITVGKTIIEAPMSRRARYFEYLAYRKLTKSYTDKDSDARLHVAPKPTMADSMYRQDFWDWPLSERHRRMHEFEFCVTQEEVVFDAADISRFGRDVFVQESMTTNRAGINWLREHLGDLGVRVHALHFPLDFFPSHIDCTFVPLRPGLVLTNPDRPVLEGEDRLFLENGWKLIDAPEPSLTNDEMPRYCQSSRWLSMNVLSLSPETVICEAQEYPLRRLLESLGLEVIAIPFRNVFEFGGSLHCATWDVRREGTVEDYFPSITAF